MNHASGPHRYSPGGHDTAATGAYVVVGHDPAVVCSRAKPLQALDKLVLELLEGIRPGSADCLDEPQAEQRLQVFRPFRHSEEFRRYQPTDWIDGRTAYGEHLLPDPSCRLAACQFQAFASADGCRFLFSLEKTRNNVQPLAGAFHHVEDVGVKKLDYGTPPFHKNYRSRGTVGDTAPFACYRMEPHGV